MVAEVEPVAGLLAFLVTENQLFEGEEMNAGWARIDARVSALFRRGQERGEFRIDLTPRLAHRGAVRADRRRAPGACRTAGSPPRTSST